LKAEIASKHQGGMWPWVMQRVTAVLLILCLAIHLTFTHILNVGKLDFDNVAARLANYGLVAVDLILLSAGIFHAFNGLRNVLMDYWFTSRGRALALTVFLWILGLALLVYGTWALWPWIGPR
jgi:succinate dehydrogenase hydrophobic membrane anchor protein